MFTLSAHWSKALTLHVDLPRSLIIQTPRTVHGVHHRVELLKRNHNKTVTHSSPSSQQLRTHTMRTHFLARLTSWNMSM